MNDDIVTLHIQSPDNGPLQYVSAERLAYLEAIEKAASKLVGLRRSFELGYRELEDAFLKVTS